MEELNFRITVPPPMLWSGAKKPEMLRLYQVALEDVVGLSGVSAHLLEAAAASDLDE